MVCSLWIGLTKKTKEAADLKLEGKVALITGGSRGIGKGIALAFAREGAAVAINYASDSKSAEQTVNELKALGVHAVALKGDVSQYENARQIVHETVSRLGELDILVNNAGICWFMPFLEITQEAWNRSIGVDLSGTFYCSQWAAKEMIK